MQVEKRDVMNARSMHQGALLLESARAETKEGLTELLASEVALA
jgi:hypothetical protein